MRKLIESLEELGVCKCIFERGSKHGWAKGSEFILMTHWRCELKPFVERGVLISTENHLFVVLFLGLNQFCFAWNDVRF